MTVTVRTTHLEVRIDGELDVTAFAATCSFGFDQRYAEATVRRTGGGGIAIGYWSQVEIAIGCDPGEWTTGPALRFSGYVVPIDNVLFPIENVLSCRGRLYRAAFVKNATPGGTDLAPVGSGGVSDEAMVEVVLADCGVASGAFAIEGTAKALGSLFVDLADVLSPGPFTWAEGESGLSFIERLDEVSVPDDGSGRFRTFEGLGGEVVRRKLVTAPDAAADAEFEEGVDVLEARISRDPAGASNRVTVTGSPLPLSADVGGITDVVIGSQARFTASSDFAPYLPGGVSYLTTSFGSPMIEKSTRDDPDYPEDVISCQQVAEFLLGEVNTVLDTLTFSTPRDDLLSPGQTVHLHSARLGLIDPTRHYWVQHLEVTLDEAGAFTQRLVCVRRS